MKTMKNMNFREKITMKAMKMGKIAMKTTKSWSTMTGNPDEHENGGVLTQ